jgi:predicted CxxxxCH...CXXCH cytochrome family protein
LPTYRNITTGAVKGNHSTHAAATLDANVCAKCHGSAAVTYNTKHAVMNHYSIQIAPTVNYNKNDGKGVVTSFPQTDTPVLGTCSTVDCHFESVATPKWGSDPLGAASPTTCNTCHSYSPSTDSHAVHIAEYNTGGVLNACSYCHTDHSIDAKPFQHATSVGRPIEVKDAHLYIGSNGQYLPSQSAGRVLGSCQTASCHNDGKGNLIATPTWGSAVARCTVCHLSSPTSGSHFEHLKGAQVVCASCHNGAVESSTLSTLHGNNLIDVYKSTAGDLGYPAGRAMNSPYTTCTTASCHIDPSNNGAQKISPTWGDTLQPHCSFCHAARPASGSHTAHFNAGAAATLCANCHAGAVENTTLSTNHNNNLIDIGTASGSLGYTSPKAIGSAASRCTTASCHDDGRGNTVQSPLWGTANNDCSACHANLPNTGSHVQHISGVGFTCGNCHKGAVQGTTAPLLHMNNVVDVYKTTPGDFGGGYASLTGKAKGTTFGSCTTVNCHGRLSPVWGANTGNYQCTKCHGMGVALANYSSATHAQAAPGYAGVGLGVGRQTGTVSSFVSNDPKVGAHDSHLRSLNNLGHPAECKDCHVVPATAVVAGHMDGSSLPTWSNLVKNVETVTGSARPYTFGSGALVSNYDSVTGTCSNIYCHGASLPGGTDKAPKWTDGTYLTGTRATDCAKCHGYPPETSTRMPHSPAANFMTCTGCHPHDGTRQSTDPLLGSDFHMNGNLEATGFCNTCHDYDTRGVNGSTWGKSQIGIEGFGAHAMHINYLKTRMNVTTMDANKDVFGSVNYNGICGECHTRDVTNHQQNNRTSSLRNITFGDISSVNRQFGPNAPQYNGSSYVSSSVSPKTCSNTDCHYKTSPIWQAY